MGKLYIEKESWGRGTENDDIGPTWFNDIPEVAVAGRTIRADNARPETISHVRNHAKLMMAGADKWKGSVEDGIAFLKSFEQIVIHSRCERTAEEAKMYSYKVDRLTGDVLREVVDKWNHCWDALRYALNPLIQVSTGAGIW